MELRLSGLEEQSKTLEVAVNEKFGKSVSYLIQYLNFIPAVLIASAPF